MSLAAPNFESNAPDDAPSVAVVLCCTAGDVQVVTSLSQALKESHKADPQVVLLEGAHFDELSSLASRNAGCTVLYVLCRGSDMSVAAIQQVRTVLRGHAGGQFMTLQVSSVERMESALSAALSGPRFAAAAPKRVPPATIHGVPAANTPPVKRGAALPGPRGMMTNPPAPPQATPPAPRTLLGAAGAPGGLDAPSTMMGQAPPEGPAFSGGPRTMMGQAPAPEGDPRFAANGLPSGPGTMMGQAPPPERLPGADAGPGTMMGQAPPPEGAALNLAEPGEGSGWVGQGDDASISGSATMTFDVSAPQASSNLDADPTGWQQWLAQGQQAWKELWASENRNLKLGVAGGLIVLIPAIALLMWFAVDDDSKEEQAQALAVSSLHDDDPVQQDPRSNFDEPVYPAAQPSGQAAQPKAQVQKKPKAELQAQREPVDAAEPDAVKYREFLKVEAALRSSKIRGLDHLIIDTSKSKKFTFRSARRHCNRKEAGKLSGWRLPTGREMSRVAAANMLGKGSFWAQPGSRSKSSRSIVWDGKRKKIVKKAAKFRGARAICVRDRVSTAAGR